MGEETTQSDWYLPSGCSVISEDDAFDGELRPRIQARGACLNRRARV